MEHHSLKLRATDQAAWDIRAILKIMESGIFFAFAKSKIPQNK